MSEQNIHIELLFSKSKYNLYDVHAPILTVCVHVVPGVVQLVLQQLQLLDVVFVHLRLVANQLTNSNKIKYSK